MKNTNIGAHTLTHLIPIFMKLDETEQGINLFES